MAGLHRVRCLHRPLPGRPIGTVNQGHRRSTRVSAGVVSKLNKELHDKIDCRRNRNIEAHSRTDTWTESYLNAWADEIRDVPVLVAFGVNDGG